MLLSHPQKNHVQNAVNYIRDFALLPQGDGKSIEDINTGKYDKTFYLEDWTEAK